jgi:hypothetical protein
MNDLLSYSNEAIPTTIILAQHAEVIRALGKRMIGDVIEIGRRLVDAKKICDHGEWLPWLEREFGWSDDTALNFMRVYEMDKSRTVRDLDLPMRALYRLAAPSTPEPVRQEILAEAQDGRLTLADVENRIAAAKAQAIEEQLSLEQINTQRLIAQQTQAIADAEKRIRDEYDGKLFGTEDVESKLEEALKPMRETIEAYKRRIEELSKPPTGAPRLDPKTSSAATEIKMALATLVKAIGKLKPDEFVAFEKKLAKVTKQEEDDVLAPTLRGSKQVCNWLTGLYPP